MSFDHAANLNLKLIDAYFYVRSAGSFTPTQCIRNNTVHKLCGPAQVKIVGTLDKIKFCRSSIIFSPPFHKILNVSPTPIFYYFT